LLENIQIGFKKGEGALEHAIPGPIKSPTWLNDLPLDIEFVQLKPAKLFAHWKYSFVRGVEGPVRVLSVEAIGGRHGAARPAVVVGHGLNLGEKVGGVVKPPRRRTWTCV